MPGTDWPANLHELVASSSVIDLVSDSKVSD